MQPWSVPTVTTFSRAHEVEGEREVALDRDVVGLIMWVFNYPAGMTGQHTFRGVWTAPIDDFEFTTTVTFFR